VHDIKEIKVILSGIEDVSKNAMRVSTLLSVIGELLSIVSLVCSFSADAALN
jgi:hypothetical protein